MSDCIYIGIDSGGTSTRALAADNHGNILGAGFSGSANPNHFSRDQIRSNLRTAITSALLDLPSEGIRKVVFVGTSGVSTSSDRLAIVDIVRGIPEIAAGDQVFVDNDTVVGLTGGLSGKPGMALIAGTGSVCFGIDEHGERYLCGGWGALADDAGSAPWIGCRALQAAVRAQDGRSAPTLLRDILFNYLGLGEPRDFIGRVHHPENGLDRTELGEIAPLVLDAYRKGDPAAREIVRDAVNELSLLVQTTSQRLFGDAPCNLILVGGLALSGEPFQTLLLETLNKNLPNVHVREPDMTPVQGAVLEALRADHVPWTSEILANIARSAPPRLTTQLK